VGDLSLAAQAKLLRVLQEGVVTRIGGTKAVNVDVRVLAATNKDLREEILENRFREDLLYRLNVVEIHVPALRERVDDIPLLVTHFADQIAASAGVQLRKFGEDAMARLQHRPWPGNVRELRNGVERLMILSAGKMVTGPDVDRLLPVFDTGAPGEAVVVAPHTFETFKQEAEKNFLLQKLRDHDWNVSETARTLRMPRSNLYKKIERYGLRRESA
jgi:two-component system nitrogen regulation response regulator NtrX